PEAAQAYARGQELQWDGNYSEAIRYYEQAIKADDGLGRAYAGLVVSHSSLRHPDEAIRFFDSALQRSGRMTEREQYRTRAAYYLLIGNYPKAIEELTTLTTRYPADDAGRSNLVLASFLARKFDDALDQGRRLADANKKNTLARNNAALYAMYAGQFD